MFSIITNLKNEFSRSVDESKLVDFKRRAKESNRKKLREYIEEIHYIMQRNFTDEKMLNECHETLKYIDKVVKFRHDIKNLHMYPFNIVITKNFITRWSYH